MSVNLSPIGGAAAQFFDNNGNPLSGGKLYTYAAGTTTPLASYTTSAGNVPHTNPIIFDSAGRVPGGQIWLTDGSVNYKFLLETSFSVLVGTFDNIPATLSGSAANIVYLPAGTGAVATTAQAKMRESVSLADFLPVGYVTDGSVNYQASLQAAFNTGKSVLVPNGTYLYGSSVAFTAHNQCIYGLGNDSILKSAAGSVYINSNGFNNLTIRDLQIDGTGTDGGIAINAGSKNCDVLNVYFNKGNQRVWLFACSHVTVQNCTFNNTGYGVIQQYGYASSYVLINGNIAQEMASDFVEANSAAASGSTSEFWTISNNVYTGSSGFPLLATECRFVGITSVRGVIINGNTVRNVAGDSAIHLEDTLGETIISNNVFDNCLVSSGNEGYIYLLNSAENVIIQGNVFLRTDVSLGHAFVLGTQSNVYTNDILFIGNRIVGNGSAGNFSGISYSNQSGGLTCTGNIFRGLVDAILTSSASKAIITSNSFFSCNAGIRKQTAPSDSGGADWLIANNVFIGTVGIRDIYTSTNTNGTNPPSRWTLNCNVFSKEVRVDSCIDAVITSNVFKSGSTLQANLGIRLVNFGNVFQDAATKVTPTVFGLPNHANDAAAAVGLIQIGGIYRNGSGIMVRVA